MSKYLVLFTISSFFVALGFPRATSAFLPWSDRCELYCSQHDSATDFIALRIEGFDKTKQSRVKGYFTGIDRGYEEWDVICRPIKNGFEILNSKYCNKSSCQEYLRLQQGPNSEYSGYLKLVDGTQALMQCNQDCISAP